MKGQIPGSSKPARRDYLKYGGMLVGGGLLAGCIGRNDGGANDSNTSGGGGGTNEPGESTAPNTTTGEQNAYSVRMAPVGDVKFESVPKRWVANNGSWADMGIALGQDPPKGLWRPNRYHTHVYDDIPGVDANWRDLTELWG